MVTDKELIAKAKRRIKRMFHGQKIVHRVRRISEKRYDYIVRHHSPMYDLQFRADKLGRLTLLKGCC